MSTDYLESMFKHLVEMRTEIKNIKEDINDINSTLKVIQSEHNEMIGFMKQHKKWWAF